MCIDSSSFGLGWSCILPVVCFECLVGPNSNQSHFFLSFAGVKVVHVLHLEIYSFTSMK